MDPEELRKVLLSENAKPEVPAADPDLLLDTGDLAHLMRNEATRINSDFTATADSAERRRLRDRYAKLDAWLTELQRLESLATPEAAAQRDTFRAMVLDEFRKWRAGGAERRARLEEIETGRKQMMEHAKAGAGPATHKRIKDEIEYLLKNYTPSNEAKIETLIDKWRRSGDPSYDPSIKIRLRNVRRKKDQSDYAL